VVTGARFLPSWEVSELTGAVVAVDVLRAFTTAAYAFAAGARDIFLVDSVAEALEFKGNNPGVLAMGEDHGHRPDGFDFSNSPVEIAAADVADRVIVQRTSAGTRGVVAARSATRLWCASLVCASATAAAINSSGLPEPTYVITGRFDDVPDATGDDDYATAAFIEQTRIGAEPDAALAAHAVATSREAKHTLSLGY
jgi:2-phosphosulfolactate phosphatase